MKIFTLLSLIFLPLSITNAQSDAVLPREEKLITKEFTFVHNNTRYSAAYSLPATKSRHITIVIVPGHGRTDFVGGRQYFRLRQFFSKLGFTTLVWDKKGCGKSQGTYEHHQPVESSSLEALAAIDEFRRQKIDGSEKIGLWGISRAGWICPLMISKDSSLAFWISVSGTDQFDTFRYMVEANLKIEGHSNEYVSQIMKEWDHYVLTIRKGGESYQQFVASTKKLFEDPFYISLGEKRISESEFKSAPDYYKTSGDIFDAESGLKIFVPNFEQTLRGIKCPVLALMGENDSQVSWRNTKALYEKAIQSNLTVKTFPDCNHNMMKCKTGGRSENLTPFNQAPCDGFYETMANWLTNTIR
jgi:alpha-beta hydrolase superfamily lysophospholipase